MGHVTVHLIICFSPTHVLHTQILTCRVPEYPTNHSMAKTYAHQDEHLNISTFSVVTFCDSTGQCANLRGFQNKRS